MTTWEQAGGTFVDRLGSLSPKGTGLPIFC